jgi:microcystin-dependent protein
VSQPYVGEIRIVGFNFAPAGWSFANGASLPISQNEVLFNLVGTIYGGDGVNTFALPNLQGRMPMHAGLGTALATRVIGQGGGAEIAAFNAAQVPSTPQTPIQVLASPNSALGSISPFLVVSFIISLFGVFPSQN